MIRMTPSRRSLVVVTEDVENVFTFEPMTVPGPR
jgi:hypothetical protein